MTAPATFGSTLVSVVAGDGRRCVGHLVYRGRDGYQAYDANDRPLGCFVTQAAAIAAIAAQNPEAA
jgi:hypothetical protein